MALAAWTIIGIFVDAFKHSTDPGLETFWTPWHALFYSGFLANSAWLVHLSLRRRTATGTIFDWAPRAHRLALIGVVLFATGGVGDAIWHSVFGVETSLDALLSPTHIVLWLGGLAIVSTPLRAAWSDRGHDDAASLAMFAPILASLTLTLSIVAFFLTYAWQLVDRSLPLQRYFPGGGGEFEAAYGVVSIIVTTAVMMTALLLPARRWRLPFGSVTILFGAVTLLMALGFDKDLIALPAAIAAGLKADILSASGQPRRVIAAATPAVLWLVYFFLVGQAAPGLAWPPEIWIGATIFAVLVGVGIDAAFDVAGDLAETSGGVPPPGGTDPQLTS